jgi:hypothetical protein
VSVPFDAKDGASNDKYLTFKTRVRQGRKAAKASSEQALRHHAECRLTITRILLHREAPGT